MNVLKEVKTFCNQKNITGALLLTGKWGCGKSHFIQYELSTDNDIKNKFSIIKISLFGIKTPEQFNLTLKKEYLRIRYASSLNKENMQMASEGFSIAKKIISKFVPGSNFVVSTDWSVFGDKDILLIFDDLERCGLDVDVVLGLLNEYIETKQFKTIIIANEETISINKSQENSQSATYIKMKEKIISRTIKLSPNHSSIIKNIINTYDETEQGYKEFLHSNLSDITNVFLDSKYDNIRSLKCAIQDFERFLNKICIHISSNEIKSCMLYNFLAIVFEYKGGDIQDIGQAKSSDENDDIYHKLIIDYKIKNKYKNFNSKYKMEAMEKWVINGEWNEDLLETELNEIVASLNESDPKIILLTYDLTYVEDKILEDGFAPLLEDAYNGILQLNNYITIFRIIACAKCFKISLPCVVDCIKLKNGVKKRIAALTEGTASESAKYFIGISDNDIGYLSDDEANIVKYIDEFREEFTYTSQRYQVLEALKSKKHKVVNEMIGKYTGAFDIEYAKMISEYYLSLKNESKSFLISLLKSSWKYPSIYSEKNIDISISGLQVLNKLTKPTNHDGKISTVLNELLSEEAAKTIEDYYLIRNNNLTKKA